MPEISLVWDLPVSVELRDCLANSRGNSFDFFHHSLREEDSSE